MFPHTFMNYFLLALLKRQSTPSKIHQCVEMELPVCYSDFYHCNEEAPFCLYC